MEMVNVNFKGKQLIQSIPVSWVRKENLTKQICSWTFLRKVPTATTEMQLYHRGTNAFELHWLDFDFPSSFPERYLVFMSYISSSLYVVQRRILFILRFKSFREISTGILLQHMLINAEMSCSHILLHDPMVVNKYD